MREAPRRVWAWLSQAPSTLHGRGAAAARVVWMMAWTYLALVVAACALLHTGGDAWWPATILLFSARWVIFLPVVPLAIAAVWRCRAALAPIAAAAVLALFGYMGLTTGWERMVPHRGGYHLRVVTFNVDGGDQLAAIWPEPLEQWNADVVALQECGDALASAIARSSGADWSRRRTRELCILSRLPIRAAAVMDRSALERVHADAAGIGGPATSSGTTSPQAPGRFTSPICTWKRRAKGWKDSSREISACAGSRRTRSSATSNPIWRGIGPTRAATR